MRGRVMAVAVLVAGPAHAGTTYFPGESEHAMLLFEDLWPCRGDLDFNDAVLRYNTLVETAPGGGDTRLVVNVTVHALGASVASGAALTLPVPTSSITGVSLDEGDPTGTTFTPVPVTVEASGGGSVIRLAADLRHTCGDAPGFLNTGDGATVACDPLVLQVDFGPGVSLPAAIPDLWLFRTDAPTHELHLPQYAGSAAMDGALFGSCDDASTAGRHFVDGTGIPFVLNIGEGTVAGPGDPASDWPRERVRIDTAWPLITAFAASGGTTDQDFYADPGNDPGQAWAGSGHTPPALVARYPYGRASDRPGLTCADILATDPGPDGVYWLDLTGGLPTDAFQTWCDMAGGGRTLVAHRNAGGLLLDTTAAQGTLGAPTFGSPGAGQTGWFKLPSAAIDGLQAASERWEFDGQASGRSVYLSARASITYGDLDGLSAGHGLAGCAEDTWATDLFYPTTGTVPTPSCWAYPTSAGSFYDYNPNASTGQGQGVTIWLAGEAGDLGRTAADPGVNCKDIYDTEPGLSGLYWIDPAGTGAFQAWCGMADGRTLLGVKAAYTQDLTPSGGIGTVAWPTVEDAGGAGRTTYYKLPTSIITVLQGQSADWLFEGEVSGRTVRLSTTRAALPGYGYANTYDNLATTHSGTGSLVGGCGPNSWNTGDFYPVTGSPPVPSCWAYPISPSFYDFNSNASNHNGQGLRVWLR